MKHARMVVKGPQPVQIPHVFVGFVVQDVHRGSHVSPEARALLVGPMGEALSVPAIDIGPIWKVTGEVYPAPPSYDHSRSDSPRTPCPDCEKSPGHLRPIETEDDLGPAEDFE